MTDEGRLREVREAKARFQAELMQNPDVHGIGVGYRRRGGQKTDELSIVVHVQRKRPESEVVPRRRIPSSLTYTDRRGNEVSVRVDVVEMPIPVPEVDCEDCAVDLEARVRPVRGGYSGGPPTSVSTGGTLGGWVWDNVTDQIVVISNDHVFGGTAGTDISQPSTFDGGSLPADRIADVLRSGTLDVSIAAPVDDDVVEAEIECGGPGVYEFADAELEMVVQKTGQTTGLTCGIVELIDYDSDHYGSHNDLWIDGDGNDFSQGGDSGSLYLERDHPEGRPWRRCVGIHWGGAGNDGVGHPIAAVTADLDLSTVCAGLLGQFLDAVFDRDDEREADRRIRLRREEAVRAELLARPIPPMGRREWRRRPPVPRRRRRPFSREVERRMRETRRGAETVDLLHRHRAAAVRVLMNPDGRRAALAALAPIATSAVTTDDVLAHEVTADDVANVERLLVAASRVVGAEIDEPASFVRRLLRDAVGKPVRVVLE